MEGLNMVRLSWMVLILPGFLLNVSSSSAEEERIVIVSTNTRFYLSKGPSYNFNQLPISVGSPGGLDFDGDIDMIFWTDSNSRTIKRAKLDDTRSTRVISTESDPGAIAIDENENLIFWTHYVLNRYKRTIERVTYDGREKTIIIEGDRYLSVHSIVLDKITRYVTGL
nr:nidogen-1-like [Lytechinus pictus]